ncbi:hypothetical protein EUGRSUZ_G00552 [Eucalyptus grandis]|uniref:Uncharacterized protein n=2 Tax=Eucalyptus grandis TaxID=71139 RepID=A0ACC3K1L1_EUCGR|nr:hypothetical protein EUGRSUZ_G00552 [Eucalyptus grandis]
MQALKLLVMSTSWSGTPVRPILFFCTSSSPAKFKLDFLIPRKGSTKTTLKPVSRKGTSSLACPCPMHACARLVLFNLSIPVPSNLDFIIYIINIL